MYVIQVVNFYFSLLLESNVTALREVSNDSIIIIIILQSIMYIL